MIIIIDKNNNKIIKNLGTNSLFPDGNISNVELKENEIAIRVHDNSQEASQIMQAQEYSILPKLYEQKSNDEEGNEIIIDSWYIIDNLTIIKTKEEYITEYKQTNEYKRQQILQELQELDKIVTRVCEDIINTLSIVPYQLVLEAITRKQELREMLSNL